MMAPMTFLTLSVAVVILCIWIIAVCIRIIFGPMKGRY